MTTIVKGDFIHGRWNWGTRRLPFLGIRNKDAVIFPQRVNGRYVMLHRIDPDICIAYSDDLIHWFDIMSVMKPQAEGWDNGKIGVAGPPVKINEGWLVIYHGVSVEWLYSLGIALLDLNHPEQVLYRSKEHFWLRKKIMNALEKFPMLFLAAATLFWMITFLFIMGQPIVFFVLPPSV